MSKLIDQFKVGNKVIFELNELDAPLWSHTYKKRLRCHPPKYGYGDILHVGKDLIITTIPLHKDTGAAQGKWRWLIDAGTLAQEGYVRLAEQPTFTAHQRPSETCQCDSFTMTWHGHDDGCPEKKEKKLTYMG